MLSGHQLYKHYGNRILFKYLSFSFPLNGLVVLTGASGTGKTTFLNALNQLVEVEGIISFRGIHLKRLNAQKTLHFRQHHIGAVYQHLALLEEATVGEHLDLSLSLKVAAQNRKRIQKEIIKRLKEFLPEVKLTDYIYQLSRGQKQRFAIVQATINHPSIILLDEPTTGLDRLNREKIYDLISSISKNALVIMSTHHLKDIKQSIHQVIEFPFIGKAEGPLIQAPKPYPLIIQTEELSKRWQFLYQWKKLKKEKGKVWLTFFQSILFTFLLTVFSFSHVLGNEFLTFSNNMIGGTYQYIEQKKGQELKLFSTTYEDINNQINLELNDIGMGYYYQTTMFNMLDYQEISLSNGGFHYPLQKFSFQLFNESEWLPLDSSYLYQDYHLEDLELMLGVLPEHVRLLAFILNTFPSIEVINQRLAQSPLPIYFRLGQWQWGYDDEFILYLKHIRLSEKPMMFHARPDYATLIYEQIMRLPTKDLADVYDHQPWRLSKTVSIHIQETARIIKNYVENDRWHNFHIHKLSNNRIIIYRQQRTTRSLQKLPYQINQHAYLTHTESGYHFYPQQQLSGFSALTLIGKEVHTMQEYEEAMTNLNDPYQWMGLITPNDMMRGHVLLPSMMSLKLQPIHEKIDYQEIILSSMVVNQLNVSMGQTIYLTTIYEDDLNAQALYIPLKIIGVVQETLPLLYQHSLWYPYYLLEMMRVPSHQLIPNGYAVYGESIDIGLDDISYNPLSTVIQQLEQWQRSLMILIIAALFIFGLPAFVMFYSQFHRFTVASIPSLKTMIALGGSIPMMIEFTMMKLDLIGLEIYVMAMVGFLLIDIEMKKFITDIMYFPSFYRFPWVESFVFIIILLILRFTIKVSLSRRIRKLLIFN
jgi:ABC-type lipoprotein export system ATPase subunit